MRVSRIVTLAIVVAGLVIGAPASAPSLASLSNQDAVAGLKDALIAGFGEGGAASSAGDDGFLGNAKVKIPLPDSTQARRERDADGRHGEAGGRAGVVSMNRAAETAVPGGDAAA